MKMNIRHIYFFIFIWVVCFLSLSNVYAFEDNNSTDLLPEDNIGGDILCDDIGELNDTQIDTYFNSSDVVKYYHGSERYGAYLYDANGGNLGKAIYDGLTSMVLNFI